jgi:hypothetical protein
MLLRACAQALQKTALLLSSRKIGAHFFTEVRLTTLSNQTKGQKDLKCGPYIGYFWNYMHYTEMSFRFF